MCFFFKQKTAYEMRISDWSSDVCSSDLQSLQRPLDFTPAAAAKVRELIAEEGNPELKLRVYIQGGGCSGFQYGFEFDEQQGEDDLAIDTDAIGRATCRERVCQYE